MLRLNLVARKFFVKAPVVLLLLVFSARSTMALSAPCSSGTTYVGGMGCVNNTTLTFYQYAIMALTILDEGFLFWLD